MSQWIEDGKGDLPMLETSQGERIKALEAELAEANQRMQTTYEMLRFGKDELPPSAMGDLLLCGAAQTIGAANGMVEQIAELKAENERLKEAIKEIGQTYKDSSGYEPSISVFHRALWESVQLVGK